MRLIYPYNEVLPQKKAHDVFIMHECQAFADLEWDVSLLCGKGGFADLFGMYDVKGFTIDQIPIIRKNNFLNISWNVPFFWQCQKKIEKSTPHCVVMSVEKQARYHLRRKLPQVTYVYEVHQLPHNTEWMTRADLITVTTSALKEKLHGVDVPIEVVPLGVNAKPLPSAPQGSPFFHLMYVGQLYALQGIRTLLSAIKSIHDVSLTLVGGSKNEIAQLEREFGARENVHFTGHVPYRQLAEIVKHADAFVAPFENQERMPYVAHTKLYEYAEWGRPFIAPNLPSVVEHFAADTGVHLFEAGNPDSLAKCIKHLMRQSERPKPIQGRFTWQKRAEIYRNLLTPLMQALHDEGRRLR